MPSGMGAAGDGAGLQVADLASRTSHRPPSRETSTCVTLPQRGHRVSWQPSLAVNGMRAIRHARQGMGTVVPGSGTREGEAGRCRARRNLRFVAPDRRRRFAFIKKSYEKNRESDSECR
jgi:hypothetical protein